MKFHEYKTLWEEMRARFPRHVTEEKFYAVAMAGGVRAGNGLVLAEGIWKQLRRPYYQVYPAIIPALLNLRLDIQTSLIHTPMPALLVRLPADKPIDELPGVQTALMCQDAPGDDLRLWVNFMRPTGLANMHITLGCEPGKTLEQSFQESAAKTQSYVVSGNFYSEEYMPMVVDRRVIAGSGLSLSHRQGFRADDLAANGNGHVLQGHVAARSLHCCLGNPHQAGTAGHFHVDDGHAMHVGRGQYRGQLLDIGLPVVQFRAADHNWPAAQQPPVEISHCKGHAVGHQEQIGAAQERGVGRHQPELDRPVPQGGQFRWRLTAGCDL